MSIANVVAPENSVALTTCLSNQIRILVIPSNKGFKNILICLGQFF